MIVRTGQSGHVNDARLFTDSSLYINMLFDQDYYFPNNTVILADSAFPIMKNMLPPYPITTEDPKQQVFNKAYAKTCHHIENAFGLLVQKWHFLLRHLYFLARNILEDTLCTFENQVHGFDAYTNGGDDNDVEIEVEDLDPFMNEIPVDLENASRTVNRSVRQLQSAHNLSQEHGRQRRERMMEVMRPLTETQTRWFQADLREQQRQQRRQKRQDSQLRAISRRGGRRNNDQYNQ
ncbi:hypothetical protein PHYBLDRAFT_71426 [Phycomyces blakesleeanus NRRL 1555(-)]|uniref:DDE Tnp4 domain-containing protein n=1 Tax=Phycomyces blakesleeanus (strain ATCC 8743b / DSM 1359 / FGSC 10004 / NBRC 33097 / NRRL 1555) TaxID=763407 RepID=A0A162XEA5_PHYB8|nr:hypothetical protein PHYBLDRAFT_71426 [Phycomyces blakesleeanus NRRL 1555(-)]OAD74305.1 hypothetical protein PHYBLDRAFT_71426 [Phycomyces blakesleeanus NRRL 1555(-)]|eukprot:XP_018292345.1 hypothetical protein PHYBLDRAFT_71426 [Phycomyces blakesleeanus NRRL 1555(-)]